MGPAKRDDDAFVLTRRHFEQESTQTIHLELAKLTALMLVDEQLFVGAGRTLGVVRWDEKNPTLKIIKDRSDASGKAYDLFARAGNLVVAIDDMVLPMFAELLELDVKAGFKHLQSWELPGLVNGRYHGALLEIDKSNQLDGRLFLLDAFSVITGTGQNLAALTMKEGRLSHGSDTIINSMIRDEPPVLEESTKRGASKPEKVLAGDKMTFWSSLAFVPGAEQIAIAAGERGLLLVPKNFSSKSPAAMFDVGGLCLDVIASGKTLYVLVEDGSGGGKLVRLQVGRSSALELVDETKLPGIFQRFVR